jgi:hypothetical protein
MGDPDGIWQNCCLGVVLFGGSPNVLGFTQHPEKCMANAHAGTKEEQKIAEGHLRLLARSGRRVDKLNNRDK